MWPNAITPELLFDTQNGIRKRAQVIIEMFIDDDLRDLKFIDFGCQNSAVVDYSKQYTALSVGYGTVEESKNQNAILTKSFDEVRSYGPFDVVLAFDVIDHINEPKQAMLQMLQLVKSTGKIYLRTHHWLSRNATHDKSNLAYIHLTDKPQEGVLHNDSFFEDCGLKIIKVRKIIEEVEPFFSSENLCEVPDNLQYSDYVLQKNIRWYS